MFSLCCAQLLSCWTFYDPMDCSPPRLLCPWGFSRQEYRSGLPCPPPEDCPKTGIKPRSPALQADCLLSETPKFYLSLDKRIYFFTRGITRYGNGFIPLNTGVLNEPDLACNEKPTYFYPHFYILLCGLILLLMLQNKTVDKPSSFSGTPYNIQYK